MIISVDHSGLEWVGAVYLSQDKTGIREILNGFDQHEDNRQRFKLPTRLIAKTFLFRLIYGGTAFAYANDSEFTGVSSDPEFWQNIITEFYTKYPGIAAWHKQLIDEVGINGKYTCPTGCVYYFEPYEKNGVWKLPETKIKNYPVQGLGSKLVMLSRILLARRMGLYDPNGFVCRTKLINTVHDDIWLDCPEEELRGIDKDGKVCYNISSTVKSVFDELPAFFEKSFGVEFNLPTRYEIKTILGEKIK